MAAGKQNRQQQGVKEYTVEQRARAVADLATGESVHATARKYGASTGTIRRWREQAGMSVVPAPGDPQKRDEVAALVMEYLREALLSGIAVARQAHDEGWRAKQNAHDLAVFLGVLFDKSAIVLQALPDPVLDPRRLLAPGDGAGGPDA